MIEKSTWTATATTKADIFEIVLSDSTVETGFTMDKTTGFAKPELPESFHDYFIVDKPR